MNNNGTLAVEKVTAIETKQPQAQCRFTIQASLRGFPVTIEGEGRAGDLKIIVDRLFDLGAQPPASVENLQIEPTKNGAPVCPDHGTVMKPSKHPGKFYCPRSMPDGGYCRHSAKA